MRASERETESEREALQAPACNKEAHTRTKKLCDGIDSRIIIEIAEGSRQEQGKGLGRNTLCWFGISNEALSGQQDTERQCPGAGGGAVPATRGGNAACSSARWRAR